MVPLICKIPGGSPVLGFLVGFENHELSATVAGCEDVSSDQPCLRCLLRPAHSRLFCLSLPPDPSANQHRLHCRAAAP